ncbi:hypothetical protein [Alkalihalobacterium sp. APHAB7]
MKGREKSKRRKRELIKEMLRKKLRNLKEAPKRRPTTNTKTIA